MLINPTLLMLSISCCSRSPSYICPEWHAMLKLFKYFRGDKIDCPMKLSRPEFIADLAKNETDRRERAKITRAGGYTAKFIEGVLSKRRKESETE